MNQTPPRPLLALDHISKSYDRVQALAAVTLVIEKGAFFALLGPSAAGKTTLLRSIAGLERPDQGRIYFADTDVTRAPVQGRNMAMVFQTFALYPHLSVADNLTYPLREARLGKEVINRRLGEIAELLRISHTLPRRPNTLSGGEQQRVAIGRALIRQPELLLLDEPLTNLDAKLRHEMRLEFKRLHRDLGITMIFATPDQLEALSMGEEVGVIDRGRILQVGSPKELYEKPRSATVAGYVGSPPINLLPATVRMTEQAPALELPFGLVPAPAWRGALQAGAKVVLGVRPNDLRPSGDHLQPMDAFSQPFQADIRVTEPLGDVTIVDLRLHDHDAKMILSGPEAYGLHAGDKLDLAISLRDIQLFHRETGVRIPPGQAN